MNYEEFVDALDKRPENMSPLTFASTLKPRPVQIGAWLLRWAEEQRSGLSTRTTE